MPLHPGSLLHERYLIERQLGKGGMGAVYLALDQTLDIRVAIKENLNLNPESERQFRREAKLLAELRHPNLPRVTDHFILEGRQYLAMDFIAGEDLHKRSQQQSPSVDEVLAWADAMCSALIYLHSRPQPVIHRDIKPPNIKLQPDGTAVLVDFGLAKEFDQSVTATGARGLTPGYSPPEQYGAQSTDARSDQYSLAATIYSLLTGKRPADSIDRMLENEVLESTRTPNPLVPEYVDAAISRALEIDPKDRFPDVESFRAALRGQLTAETIRPEHLPQVRPRRSRRGLFIGVSAIAILLTLVVVALVQGGGLPASRPQTTPLSTELLLAAVEASSTPAPTSTTTPIPPTSTPSSTTEPSPTSSPTTTPTPHFIGGGGGIAFISDREDGILQIWTMNPDGSNPRQLTFGPGDKSQPQWSPDGTRLLYVTQGGQDEYGNKMGLDLKIINADGTKINWVTHDPGDDTDPTWSPDGTKIAFTSTRVNDIRQVFVLEADCLDQSEGCENIKPRNISCSVDFCYVEFSPAWAPENLSPPAWLPSAHILTVALSVNRSPAKIYFRPLAPENPTDFDRTDRIIGIDHIEWSPDGAYITYTFFYNRGVNEIYSALVSNRGTTNNRLTETNGNKEPAYSPDGLWIVFTSTRDQNPEVYIMTANGVGEENLTNLPGRDMQPDWQPIGD